MAGAVSTEAAKPGGRKWHASNRRHDQLAGVAGGLDQAAPVDDPDMAAGKESQRRRIDTMLDRQHAGRQGRGGVVIADPDRSLGDDRPRIHVRRNPGIRMGTLGDDFKSA